MIDIKPSWRWRSSGQTLPSAVSSRQHVTEVCGVGLRVNRVRPAARARRQYGREAAQSFDDVLQGPDISDGAEQAQVMCRACPGRNRSCPP